MSGADDRGGASGARLGIRLKRAWRTLLGAEEEIRSAVARSAEPAEKGAPDPLLEAAVAALPDPVVALDRGGKVVAFNAEALAVLPALRRGDAISLALRVPEVLDAIRRASASGVVQRVEFSERVPTGRWFQAVVMPLIVTDAAAPAEPVLMTLHDLTPLRRVEEMRADFIANASHELRTPLAALSGFIETLQGPAKDDPAAREKFLTIMQGQARRMARLIDDLLSLSRIELNVNQRPEVDVVLGPVIRQVVDGLQGLARERGVDIAVTVPADDDVSVKGDRDELIRLFENLIENALKYGASGKRVEVTLAIVPVSGAAPEARVSVRDYGPGIAPEHLPRLTERFYRVDVGESRTQGGTGLGLALVKHILNRHRGRLSIESKAGQGATFSAYFPLQGAWPANRQPGVGNIH